MHIFNDNPLQMALIEVFAFNYEKFLLVGAVAACNKMTHLGLFFHFGCLKPELTIQACLILSVIILWKTFHGYVTVW